MQCVCPVSAHRLQERLDGHVHEAHLVERIEVGQDGTGVEAVETTAEERRGALGVGGDGVEGDGVG